MNKYFYLLILSCLSFSCKDKIDVQNVDHKAAIITKPWKRALVDQNPATSPAGINLYYAATDCELDDRYTFKNNDELSLDKGLKKCEGTEQQLNAIKYMISDNQRTIKIDTVTYQLTEVSDKQLKFYKVTPPTNSRYNAIVYIFEH